MKRKTLIREFNIHFTNVPTGNVSGLLTCLRSTLDRNGIRATISYASGQGLVFGDKDQPAKATFDIEAIVRELCILFGAEAHLEWFSDLHYDGHWTVVNFNKDGDPTFLKGEKWIEAA